MIVFLGKKLCLVSLLFFLAVAEASTRPTLRGLADTDSDIKGGMVVTDPKKYPYFVNVGDGCGGSMIHDDIMLTAGTYCQ